MSLVSLFARTCFHVVLGVLALIGIGVSVGVAEERELPAPRSAIDAVLLIDASGSMMLTDPANLRYEGAKLLLQFLGKGDRLGVVAFSDAATVVSELKPFAADTSEQVVQKIQSIKTEGRYTDLLEAVKAGSAMLESNPRDDAQRVMILLSDGKMEPESSRGTSTARTQELVNDLLPDLKTKEIKVHTLAFSSQADRELLGEIAGVTDGLNWFTKDPGELQKSFADLFLAVKRPQVVQLTSKGFRIDDDVEEATFYVNHEEGATLSLSTPRGNDITAEGAPEWVTWFVGKTFDVITLREPEPGDWQIQGVASSDGFATVLTNLKLVTDWPSIVRAEDKVLVQARLYESEKPVALPEMSGVIKYAFQIAPTDKISEPIVREFLNDEGQNGDRIAKDGIFSSYVTIKDSGEYRLTILARAPTFQRSQQMPFKVKPRLVTLRILDGETEDQHHHEGSAEHNGEQGKEEAGAEGEDKSHEEASSPKKIITIRGTGESIFQIELSQEVSSFRMTDVKLMAKAGDRKRYELPLKRSPSNQLVYEFVAGALPEDGKYLLQAFLRAETKKRQEVEAESKKIIFERSLKKAASDAPVSVVLKTEEDEPPKPEKFPLIPLAVVTALNGIIAFVGSFLVKRMAPKSGMARSRYLPPREVVEAISALSAIAERSDVDLNDPIFESLEQEDAKASAPQPSSEAPADQEPEAQSEVAAEVNADTPIEPDQNEQGGEQS